MRPATGRADCCESNRARQESAKRYNILSFTCFPNDDFITYMGRSSYVAFKI